MFKVLERLFNDKIATEEISLSGSERYRGKLSGSLSASCFYECASVCPVGAFQVSSNTEGYNIDYKKCVFCGRCVEKAMLLGGNGLRHSNDDVMPFVFPEMAEVTADVLKERLGRSLHVRHLDAGSCNGCDFDMGALSGPVYDLARYGVHFVASPRHADLLMITGVVTRNLEQALRMTYEAMPEPRLVMACGACAAGGSTYGASYAIVGAADKVVPVDIYVPGCPPRPSAMIAGLLAAADILKKRM